MFGEASKILLEITFFIKNFKEKVCYFNLNVASTSYIYDAWGSYSEISFGLLQYFLKNITIIVNY